MAVLWVAVALAVIVLYWSPTVVAWARDVPDAVVVTLVNLLVGWTVIGWVVAMRLACRGRVGA